MLAQEVFSWPSLYEVYDLTYFHIGHLDIDKLVRKVM